MTKKESRWNCTEKSCVGFCMTCVNSAEALRERKMLKTKPPKQKTCKICKVKFTPTRELQPTCTEVECMTTYAVKHLKNKAIEKKKVARKELREFKAKDAKVLKELAQKIFNMYIRERDAKLPCISCGTTNNIQYHASHFKPAGGYSYLRFDENNVHKACVRCNSHLAGNLVPYRVALIEKIGIKEVERLEKPNQLKRWEADELQEIITTYRAKIKELLNAN